MTQTRNEIRIERIVDARREDVFRAWTDPNQLMKWWGPATYSTPYAEVDLRPGGSYLLVMRADGGGDPMHLIGTYREVTPRNVWSIPGAGSPAYLIQPSRW